MHAEFQNFACSSSRFVILIEIIIRIKISVQVGNVGGAREAFRRATMLSKSIGCAAGDTRQSCVKDQEEIQMNKYNIKLSHIIWLYQIESICIPRSDNRIWSFVSRIISTAVRGQSYTAWRRRWRTIRQRRISRRRIGHGSCRWGRRICSRCCWRSSRGLWSSRRRSGKSRIDFGYGRGWSENTLISSIKIIS